MLGSVFFFNSMSTGSLEMMMRLSYICKLVLGVCSCSANMADFEEFKAKYADKVRFRSVPARGQWPMPDVDRHDQDLQGHHIWHRGHHL